MPPGQRSDLGKAVLDAFDAVFVINLPERLDRRAEIQAELEKIGLSMDTGPVKHFPAVRPDDMGGWPSIGARGCFESHLAILELACAKQYDSVLLLEDDASFSPGLFSVTADDLQRLFSADWQYLYGGTPDYDPAQDQVTLQPLAPDAPLTGSHFMALRGPALGLARDALKAMTERPAGHPDGGPMHVDGAYNHLRVMHPQITAVIARPGLAYQRASRTDIQAPKWFDRVPGVSKAAAMGRRLRNRLRS